jgi:hypothetical protein
VRRLRRMQPNAFLERLRDDPVLVRRDSDELQPELGCDRPQAGISDRLAEHGLARFYEHREDANHRGMGARRHEQPILGGNERAPPEPCGCGVAVRGRAAKTLIAQKRLEIARDAREAIAHSRDQRRILGLGGHVHRKIGARPSWRRLAAHHRGAPNERAAAHDRLDQPALARFNITARDGCEVERQAIGERPLRRQAIARGEPPGGDIGRYRFRDGEIAGPFPAIEGGRPRLHRRLPRARIDWTVLRGRSRDIGRRPVFKAAAPIRS